MWKKQEKNSINFVNELAHVVWDIVPGKNIHSYTCAASEMNSEPYVNHLNIGGPI